MFYKNEDLSQQCCKLLLDMTAEHLTPGSSTCMLVDNELSRFQLCFSNKCSVKWDLCVCVCVDFPPPNLCQILFSFSCVYACYCILFVISTPVNEMFKTLLFGGIKKTQN